MSGLYILLFMMGFWFMAMAAIVITMIVMKFSLLMMIFKGLKAWVHKNENKTLEHNCHDYECGLNDRGH